jgi:hypothetical protein
MLVRLTRIIPIHSGTLVTLPDGTEDRAYRRERRHAAP